MRSQTHFVFKDIPDLQQIRTTFPSVRGIFFDMDGTLFNTEGYHTQAMLEIGAKHNIRPPHSPEVVHSLLMGKADYLVYDIIKEWEGFPAHWSVRDFVDAKNNGFLDILQREVDHKFLPQKMRSLLGDIKKHALHVALVTSSEKLVTSELLKIAGLAQYFDLILTRDDCPRHKPDPWPYLKALSETKLDPDEALVLEDSTVGLTAAEASGCHFIKAEWYL